jgi:mycothiol synthase
MTVKPPPGEIVGADPQMLPELYAVAERSLVHDRFSRDLLTEKLFHNPQPAVDRFEVFACVADGRVLGFMQSVMRLTEARGWIGLFATDARVRRQGVARGLLEHILAEQRQCGLATVEALAIPSNYFTPGLDPRYTAGLGLLERNGFERFGDCVNLRADLTADFPTRDDEQRLADAGVEVRRAGIADDGLLTAFFATEFGPSWLLEARLALRNDPPALHLALRDGRIIAFSGHSSQNREWGFFGPMGTLPETRGLGIGRVLLRRCLNDLRAAGHQRAVIPWVGPIAFYAHHVGAEVERVFWRYRRKLDAPAPPR